MDAGKPNITHSSMINISRKSVLVWDFHIISFLVSLEYGYGQSLQMTEGVKEWLKNQIIETF